EKAPFSVHRAWCRLRLRWRDFRLSSGAQMNGGEVEFVRLTGQPRAMRGSDELDFLPDKRFHLLTYLAYNSGWVGRERAAFLFWPDADTEGSRRNLRGLLQ